MRKNKISKIAFLTGLLIINTNTKGFYQCVPKQDWFKKQYYILRLEEKFKTAKEQINNHNLWRLVEENKTSGSLDFGVYRVIVAGGAGGNGGDAGGSGGYGYGGAGQIDEKIFFLDKLSLYYACIGLRGSNGKYGGIGGSGGGGGGGSLFYISDVVNISVLGGGGGGGDSSNDGSGNFAVGGRGGGGGYGCGKGGKGGYGSANKDHISGGSVTFTFYLDGIDGEDGKNYEYYLGEGVKAGIKCESGGKGGLRGTNGSNGGSCASAGNGNSGDGYVKIYKYIG